MASVLITDDEESILEFFENTLSEVGFDVYTARDGQEALEMMVSLQPDLMLVDLMMPRLGGVGLIKAVRKEDQNIPILVITGANDDALEQEAKDHGANACLPKPLEFSLLEAEILRLVGNNIDTDHEL